MNTAFYVQHDADGNIVGTGYCPEIDVKNQIAPEGGGVLRVNSMVHPAQMGKHKVVAGVLTPVP